MQNRMIILLGVIGISAALFSAEHSISQQLDRLDATLAMRSHIDAVKHRRIDSLQRCLYLADEPYDLYKQLYQEYRSYKYDTALVFAQHMYDEAVRKADSALLLEAQVSRAFVYLSGGLFHEAYQVLNGMTWAQSDAGYLLTFARLLYDMSDYTGSTGLSDEYNRRGNAFMSALATHYSASDSAVYWYPLAVIDLRNGDYERSIARMLEALRDSRLSAHDQAIYASSLAYLYRQTGNNDAALSHYIDAAIHDIESSTYETIAMRMIAEILYEQGEIVLADKYIHIAMSDARAYNARHRQVSISQVLPIIEENYKHHIQQRATVAYILFAVVLLMLIIGVTGIILLIRRNKAIHDAQHTIDDMNRNLTIANKIKEELLCSLLVGHSQYLNAVEQYQNMVKERVVQRRTNELMTVPKNVDARLQRQLLYRRLDDTLLSIFPTFVGEFNALLLPEHTMEIKPDEKLNPALRIFALIRLGITQNEVIADILDYSINTIYTYKTRTINHSRYDADAFYTALMHIAVID